MIGRLYNKMRKEMREAAYRRAQIRPFDMSLIDRKLRHLFTMTIRSKTQKLSNVSVATGNVSISRSVPRVLRFGASDVVRGRS